MINSNYFNMIINIFFNLHHHLVFLTQTESLFSLNIKCSIVNITELVQIPSNFLPTEKAQTFDPTFDPIKIGTNVGQIIG